MPSECRTSPSVHLRGLYGYHGKTVKRYILICGFFTTIRMNIMVFGYRFVSSKAQSGRYPSGAGIPPGTNRNFGLMWAIPFIPVAVEAAALPTRGTGLAAGSAAAPAVLTGHRDPARDRKARPDFAGRFSGQAQRKHRPTEQTTPELNLEHRSAI